MKYHIMGHFVEDRLPDGNHFPVHHQMDKFVDSFAELLDVKNNFLKSYKPKWCYGLSIGISEESSEIDE